MKTLISSETINVKALEIKGKSQKKRGITRGERAKGVLFPKISTESKSGYRIGIALAASTAAVRADMYRFSSSSPSQDYRESYNHRLRLLCERVLSMSIRDHLITIDHNHLLDATNVKKNDDRCGLKF